MRLVASLLVTLLSPVILLAHTLYKIFVAMWQPDTEDRLRKHLPLKK